MLSCFSPLAGEGQIVSSFLSLHNAVVFSAATSDSPELRHGLEKDVYVSQRVSLQSDERIVQWLPCSCRLSKARFYLGGGFVWGSKKRTGDLMDVSGVEDILLQCQIPTLGRNHFLLDVQIQDA